MSQLETQTGDGQKTIARMVEIITSLTSLEVQYYNDCLHTIDLHIADNRTELPAPVNADGRSTDDFVPLMVDTKRKFLDLLLIRKLGRDQATKLSAALRPHNMHLERAERRIDWIPL